MQVEKKTLVWLTVAEVQVACRNYARTQGQDVSICAKVTGLDELTEAKHAVSVMVEYTNKEVP